jgi:hypothetical protein
MAIARSDIKVGETYRFTGYGGIELKPRYVVFYDPEDIALPGGRIKSHTGLTRSGNGSVAEIMAVEYFCAHAHKIDQMGQ